MNANQQAVSELLTEELLEKCRELSLGSGIGSKFVVAQTAADSLLRPLVEKIPVDDDSGDIIISEYDPDVEDVKREIAIVESYFASL